MHSWERRQVEIVNSFSQNPTSQRVKALFLLARNYDLFVSSKQLQLEVYGTQTPRAHGAIVELIKGLRLAAERENTPHAIEKGVIYGETYWRLHERTPESGIHGTGGGGIHSTAEGCGDNARISGSSVRAVNEEYTSECYKHSVLVGEETRREGKEERRALDDHKRSRSRALWRSLGAKNGS